MRAKIERRGEGADRGVTPPNNTEEIPRIQPLPLLQHRQKREVEDRIKLIRRGQMLLTMLPIAALTVNPNNDRHGELSDEATAIHWLLSQREQHMKNLAIDIVAQSKVYEPPLVAQHEERYVIYDGNRRVTCLKLLTDPTRASTQQLREFFSSQRAKWRGVFPVALDCQIETDPEVIDEMLFRRHTGSQLGVGQSQWDDTAKHNFIARTGKRKGRNVAEGVEKKLLAAGYLDSEGAIPRSNLNRLLSSEEFRNLVGISLQDGELYFTAEPKRHWPPCIE